MTYNIQTECIDFMRIIKNDYSKLYSFINDNFEANYPNYETEEEGCGAVFSSFEEYLISQNFCEYHTIFSSLFTTINNNTKNHQLWIDMYTLSKL